ncbi:MAG: hypothetical protein RIS54_1110 [Verrucomicrobiota bacterium]|jgi:hypothetical protein
MGVWVNGEEINAAASVKPKTGAGPKRRLSY